MDSAPCSGTTVTCGEPAQALQLATAAPNPHMAGESLAALAELLVEDSERWYSRRRRTTNRTGFRSRGAGARSCGARSTVDGGDLEAACEEFGEAAGCPYPEVRPLRLIDRHPSHYLFF